MKKYTEKEIMVEINKIVEMYAKYSGIAEVYRQQINENGKILQEFEGQEKVDKLNKSINGFYKFKIQMHLLDKYGIEPMTYLHIYE